MPAFFSKGNGVYKLMRKLEVSRPSTTNLFFLSVWRLKSAPKPSEPVTSRPRYLQRLVMLIGVLGVLQDVASCLMKASMCDSTVGSKARIAFSLTPSPMRRRSLR